MSNPISRLVERRSLQADVRRALTSGVGLYHTTWPIQNIAAATASEEFIAKLVGWCREVLGEMRRPYGLDYVTLAVALLREGEGQVASVNYGVLRPSDFYNQSFVEERVRETLRSWTNDQLITGAGAGSLSAVLFSWGDLTRELLLAG
ncbi:MAG: hypothetical protein IIC88_00270 [Chloroflexi bacterium]|nr:hypothetical protein [Chloroflexota bacterium]